MKSAGIVGLGFWAPETVRGNDAWPDAFTRAFHEHRDARRLVDITDIERKNPDRPYEELYVKHAVPYDDDPFKGAVHRRVADPNGSILDGDALAAKEALRDARISPREVDLILSSAVLQEKLVPSNGPGIADLLGCGDVAGIGVESYCSAAVVQLELACGLVESGRARNVLCVQSHQLNRINDMRLPASVMFGDAVGAFVVGEVPAGRGIIAVQRGGDGSLRNAVTHAYIDTPGAVWWKNASGPIVPGSDDVPAVKRFTKLLLELPIQTLHNLLSAARVTVDELAVLATIQPVPWFGPAVADGLGLSPERAPSTHRKYAHIGAAALVANLLEARQRGMLRDGALVALYGHGAGLTRYAALLRWSHSPA